ncbi:MAG: STAS domain-containing protein [Hymenobacter sp.]|nr:MAG: STAS domain-containing protein [Hymenobacter sp.]
MQERPVHLCCSLVPDPAAMTDSFLLLVFPMRTLTIHLGGHRDCIGLSLRGCCTSPADVTHLAQAVEQLLAKGVPQAWIDCRGLHTLSWVGQRALLHADASARASSTELYWCGLPAHVVSQLTTSGLASVLHLRSAAEFQGPQFLLLGAVA